MYDSLRVASAVQVLDVLQNPAPKPQALPRQALVAIYVPPAPLLLCRWWCL